MTERIPKASTVCTTEEILLDPYVRSLVYEAEASNESPEVLARLAAALNARLMHEKAEETCKAGLARSPRHPDLWWERIRATSYRGKEALRELAGPVLEIARAHPREAWASRNAGVLHYYLEEDEPCRDACERALAADPSDSRTHEVLAYRAYTLGDYERAIEHSIQAVECDAKNYRAHHWLGECYKEAEAWEPAERCFLHALQIEENDFLTLESLGELYLHRKETYPKAVQCFSRILSVNPKNWTVYLRFIEWHLGAGRTVEAAAQCNQILALGPEPSVAADAHQYLGVIHFQEGRNEQAAAELRRSLEGDPQFAPPYYYLGLIASSEKDEAAAEGLWRTTLEKDPTYASAAVRLGYLHFDRKVFDEAVRWFRKAIELDPEEHEAHLGLAEVAAAARDWTAALAHAEEAAGVAPQSGNVWNQVGIAHDALGQTDEAIEAYRKALALDPQNRQAANNLGYLYERLFEKDGSEEWRRRAIAAWKRRLLICRDSEASTRGSSTHLRKLGVGDDQIEEWLDDGRIDESAEL